MLDQSGIPRDRIVLRNHIGTREADHYRSVAKTSEAKLWLLSDAGNWTRACDRGAQAGSSCARGQQRQPQPQDPLKRLIWFSAGTQAFNANLEAIYQYPGPSTHLARLDYDDAWHEDHLATLAYGYLQVPQASFAYTSSCGKNLGYNHTVHLARNKKRCGTMITLHSNLPSSIGKRAKCRFDPHCDVFIQPPLPCVIVHATVSWRINSTVAQLRYRLLETQRLELRKPKLHLVQRHSPYPATARCDCGATCIGTLKCTQTPKLCKHPGWQLMAADSDLWDQVWDLEQRGDIISIFVAKATVRYTSHLSSDITTGLKALHDIHTSVGDNGMGLTVAPLEHYAGARSIESSRHAASARKMLRATNNRSRTARVMNNQSRTNPRVRGKQTPKVSSPTMPQETSRWLRDVYAKVAMFVIMLVAALSIGMSVFCSIGRAPAFHAKDHAAQTARWGAFVVAILQNSLGTIILRYERVTCGARTPGSAVVLYGELLKLSSSLLFLLATHPKGLAGVQKALKTHFYDEADTMLHLGVPACSYAIQNNLQLVAARYVGAVLLHIIERLKLLTTAMLGVVLLGRQLSALQWAALTIIVGGVLLTQIGHSQETSNPESASYELALGMGAALCVALLSSFASVYLEKMIKADSVSLPMRNVQLCAYSIPIQLGHMWRAGEIDYRALPSQLCTSSWALAANLAFAGLLVAFLMRYADNNLKNIAQALATVLSSVIAIPLFGFQADNRFAIGSILVIGAALVFLMRISTK